MKYMLLRVVKFVEFCYHIVKKALIKIYDLFFEVKNKIVKEKLLLKNE